MTSVLIADDHPVVRRGLRALLESEPDLNVVGEANDGLEAGMAVERLQPDVLVLDLMMGGINGLEVLRQVGKTSGKTGVVILSMYGNENYVVSALRLGAKAYVLKESNPNEVVRAVREVAAGRHYLSPPFSERAIGLYLKKTEAAVPDPYTALTSREREVLHLLVQGRTNAEVADKLFISRRTVEIHRANLMRKLNVRTQTQLIRYAMEKEAEAFPPVEQQA